MVRWLLPYPLDARPSWFGECYRIRWMRCRHGSVNVAVPVGCDTVMVRWMLPYSLYAIPSWFGECCGSRWMRYRHGSVNVAVPAGCDTVIVRWMLQYQLDAMTSIVRTEASVYNTEMAFSVACVLQHTRAFTVNRRKVTKRRNTVACVLQHTRAFTVNRRKVTKRRNTNPVVWVGMIKWDSSLRKTLRLNTLLYVAHVDIKMSLYCSDITAHTMQTCETFGFDLKVHCFTPLHFQYYQGMDWGMNCEANSELIS